MPTPPFRNARGQFSSGTLISRGDLLSKLIYSEGHWLVPSWAPKPWRLRASSIREISALFPEKAKPTIRTILWAMHHQRRPLSRVYPTCGEPSCVNPEHQEISMSLSPEICQTVFAEAQKQLDQGKEFTLRLPSEGKAIAYRFQLHTWRSRNREVLPPSFDSIKIQMEEYYHPDHGADGSFVLRFVEDRDDQILLASLEEALGHKPEKPRSAKDLAQEILQETKE